MYIKDVHHCTIVRLRMHPVEHAFSRRRPSAIWASNALSRSGCVAPFCLCVTDAGIEERSRWCDQTRRRVQRCCPQGEAIVNEASPS